MELSLALTVEVTSAQQTKQMLFDLKLSIRLFTETSAKSVVSEGTIQNFPKTALFAEVSFNQLLITFSSFCFLLL